MSAKDRDQTVKLFPDPPFLVLKQAAAIMVYAWLTGWRKRAFIRWAFQLQNLIHAGAGAKQICCFGVNPHVVWEMTSRCNLKCIHCHAFGGEPSVDELTKEEGRALIDQIASLAIRTFVFSGGEPLLREDLFELIAYARSKGLTVFIATNGTLISKPIAKLLRRYDVGVVIGLDSMNHEVHDTIRGVEGAYQAVIAGIKHCIAEQLYVHLNIVASRRNLGEIERIIDYGATIGVYSYFIYNFVPCGRGEAIRADALENDDLNALLALLIRKQREVNAILIPVAAPEYWAYALQRHGLRSRRLIKFLGQFIGGCLADKGMVYIKPNGAVWACPFLPIPVGNVRNERFGDLWANLKALRLSYARRANVCTGCDYAQVCGGCKSRMISGDSRYTCPVNKRVHRSADHGSKIIQDPAF
ncbi:MAG: radical SAM protein [Methanophagales archaeon ANME-1-THS]|nr:MAG: radical SAM protein [Methanophagales archaeon ANME-1-THS]